MAENKNLAVEITDDELDDVTGGVQYTGYGSSQNPSAAMGYRAAKLDAMRQAGGGGKVVAQGRLEDGTYFTTVERFVGSAMDSMNNAVGGPGINSSATKSAME